MDTRKFRHTRNTTVIHLDGPVGVLNNPVVATTKHLTRTSSRHQARETAAELVRRWNAYPDLVAKLEELELRATQARIASNIGQPRLKDADFLRSELERIGQSARTLLQTLKP